MIQENAQMGAHLGAATFAALGFVAPVEHIVAGLFFAASGGFAGMIVQPPIERSGIYATIVVAMVIGSLAGLMHPHFSAVPFLNWVSGLPVQLVMGVAGLSSRWLALRAIGGDLFGGGKNGKH